MIGIILAGGRARRMGGGDKGMLPVGGIAILERVLAAVRAQCESVVINANGDASRFDSFGIPVIPDPLPNQPGPLAGVLAGLDYVAQHHSAADFALTVPSDTPFLPHDLVARLQDQRVADRAAIVRACSGDKVHGVIALWSVALRVDLRCAIEGGLCRVEAFAQRHPVAAVTWPNHPFDPFLNVNTPGDLALADEAVRHAVAPR